MNLYIFYFHAMKPEHHIKRTISLGQLPNDDLIDSLLPDQVRTYANQHFSGSYTISLAAKFLVQKPDSKILDIGSGSGKFCLLGALLHPNAHFHGVEYRESFVHLAHELRIKLGIENASFRYDNILNVAFDAFNGLFMFNPFLEHRNNHARMQDFTDEPERYEAYFSHVRAEFARCPSGVRLVTFHGSDEQIPKNFKLVDRKMGDTLRFYASE
jgi:hypothetical protein